MAKPGPTILPPGMSVGTFEKALASLRRTVGDSWVFADGGGSELYEDPFQGAGQPRHLPAAAVAPASTEEVQAIVRLANEYRLPLWPVSRGKNLGYGTAAPRMSGSVVVDLGRMNKILDIDIDRAFCVLEPGVGFYDLYRHLSENKIPLWMSIPGNAWGSVLGNALERGMGMSPYGDHAAQLCGMEIVLPTGQLVRTGHAAMSKSTIGHLAPYGFGPSWDPMFMQSNFGIVCKAGMWLQPQPECTLQAMVHLPQDTDLEWAIDTLLPFRLQRTIEHHIVLFNFLEQAFLTTQRADWYEGPGALPDAVIQEIITKLNIGYWSLPLRLYGYEEVIDASARRLQRALEPKLRSQIAFQKWRSGEPIERSAANIPSMTALQSVNWYGGRGGHLSFSPLLPASGRAAFEQYHRNKTLYAQTGLDYNTTFAIAPRFLVSINMLLYDRDSAAMCEQANRLYRKLVAASAAQGYPEYRTHLTYMDTVAATFDFGGGALRRLNERLKDMIDPNGILAPGKQGIWPAAYRGHGEHS